MRALPTESELRAWDQAFQRGAVTPDLVRFVSSVGAAAVASGTLGGLSPEGEWTPEALKDAVGDFWTERLLQGALRQTFEKTDGPAAFGRYLERALRNMLIDVKRAKGAPRLRARIRKILAENDFTCVSEHSDPGEERWRLSGAGEADGKRFDGDAATLLTHLHAIGLDETVQDGSDRAAVVISNPELSRLIRVLLERVDCPLTLDEIATVGSSGPRNGV